jgi:hypothetical protein
MTAVFTAFYRDILFTSLDKVVPIDGQTNLMASGQSVYWVFFRQHAAFTSDQDPRYTGIKTVSDLAGLVGWSPPITPQSSTQAVGTITVGATTYCVANNAFTMGSGWNSSTVSAAALVLVGSYTGSTGPAVTNPVIYLTDTPFDQGVVIDSDDSLIARPSSAISGNRALLTWPVYSPPNAGQPAVTTVIPVEGSVAVLQAPPPYEVSYMQHCWLYPQRVNMVANPSFELGTNHWRSSGTVTRVQGTTASPAAPGGGSWYGNFAGSGPVVAESNMFPVDIFPSTDALWTIQAMVRGTGTLKVGLLAWERDFASTISDWGTESFILPSDGFLHVYARRRTYEGVWGMVRFECNGGSLQVDNVMCEPDWLVDWPYFDGDTTYGAPDDFAWYGGENLKGQTYSTWYNHKRAVTGRLFAWDIDEADFTITDAEVEAQGFVYHWVPAGVRVTPHLDVLYPGDIQEAVPNNAGTPVTHYSTGPSDPTGVTNPWIVSAEGLSAGKSTTVGTLR